MTAPTAERELTIVGIGASAGGLPALQAVVDHLDPASDMAYVVAQHVSADHRSMLVNLLASHTEIVVVQAENDQIVEPRRIHVCPPGFHITIEPGDRIKLLPANQTIYSAKPSIDLLFTSLAGVKGTHSIGIILSGTGEDGAVGIGAIREADGFTIAQRPDTARYDGMPTHAIDSGNVDLVLAPEEIGPELASIVPVTDPSFSDTLTDRNSEAFTRILHELQRRHGVDFFRYKTSTLSRRITRRMIATKSRSLEEYAEALVADDRELAHLFHDVLIGVSHFFRDPEAFDDLRDCLRGYIDARPEPILRFWSVGCSTGEEPYSLAILLAELLGDSLDDYRIQIFATDVNERSIDRARRGRFSALEISGLPDEVRDRHFTLRDGQYEVSKHLKQMIVFSQHDVMHDPPFLRQDLVVCRNVLIYLGPDAQDAMLNLFHYVSNPGGLLFLGRAEQPSANTELWTPESSTSRIYRASNSVPQVVPRTVAWNQLPRRRTRDPQRVRQTPAAEAETEAELSTVVTQQLEHMLAPHAIVINADNEIVYSHSDVNPLLRRRAGRATDLVFANVHPDILVDLRAALHRLRSSNEVVHTDFRSIELADGPSWVRLVLASTTSDSLGELTTIYCQVEATLGTELVDGARTPDAAGPVVVEHERQMAKLREQLAIAMEQLDQTNSEMQALNEELQSSNEELQSSNEELETTNEELQSTNEELHTAYAELRSTFTEMKAQEAELERTADEVARANQLLVMAESVGQTGSWQWQPSDEQLMWSPGLRLLLGIDEQPAPSFEALTERIVDDDRAEFETHLEHLLRGDEPGPVTFRVDRDGTPRWLTMMSVVSRGRYGNVRNAVGKLRDVTDEMIALARDAEQRDRLAEVDQKIRILLNESLNGVHVFDLVSGRSNFISESYTSMLGYHADDLNDLNLDDFVELVHPDDRDRARRHTEEMAGLGAGESRTLDYRFRHHDGHWLHLLERDSIFEVDDDGRATKMVGTFFVVPDDDD